MKSLKGYLSILVSCLAIGMLFVANVASAEQIQTEKSAHKLLVLGDSISAGYGIRQGLGWVELFKEQLASKGLHIEVVNESISGEVTAGGLSRLPKILQRIEPKWVVIELGANDGLRGLSPKAMEKNLSAMIDLAKASGAEVFLFGMKLPPNYGKQYTRLFENAYVKVAEKKQVPLLPFFLDGVGGVDSLVQSDGIHPNETAQSILMNNAWEFLNRYL